MKTHDDKNFWRSLEELEHDEHFQEALRREFPEGADSSDGFDRRRFLQVMGASVALAGAQSCRWEKTNILPLSARPDDRVPGIPAHYATCFELGGVAQPLVVTSYDGRPIKVEGNDLHGQSNGAASTFAQASLLEVYDPDRSPAPVKKGAESVDMADLEAALVDIRAKHASKRGAGLAFLSHTTSSPAMAELRRALAQQLPDATFTQYDALHRDHELDGARAAYGAPLRSVYDLSKATRIACFDADILGEHPAMVAHARAFALRRRPEGPGYDGVDFADRGETMNRLYCVEPRYTVTGSNADHRLPVRAEQVGAVLAALEAELVKGGLAVPAGSGAANEMPQGSLFAEGSPVRRFVAALAKDLAAHRGASLVAVGGTQSPSVHALAHRINAMLGNVGTTVNLVAEPDGERTNSERAIEELVDRMQGAQVGTLVILGGNPVYDAPRGRDFAKALERVETTIHLSVHRNETSKACTWHVPAAHYLESWGDALAWDGSYCVAQPLIRPIFGGRSALELVGRLVHGEWRDGQQLVREGCQARTGFKSDKAWSKVIHDGYVADSAAPHVNASLRAVAPLSFSGPPVTAGIPTNGQLELVLHGDACMYDGRFANNGWLQELPDFMTKLTWDNAAMISPATAQALGVTTRDLVRLTIAGRKVDCAVYVMPGQAAGTVSLALGYGRTAAGRVGGDADHGVVSAGFDAYALTSDGTIGHASGLQVDKLGTQYQLAMTAEHHMIDASGAKERDGEWLDPDKEGGYPERGLLTAAAIMAFNDESRSRGRVAELVRETTHEKYQGYLAAVEAKGGRAAIAAASHEGGHAAEASSANGHAADQVHGGHGQDKTVHADAADGHGAEAHGADAHGEGGHHDLDPNPIKRFSGPPLLALWQRHSYDGHRWGMSIDLSACTGCNACVVACQSENNIPVVGTDQVARGREMQWIRIDRYFSGDPDDPQVARQPINCLQCEDAPCEEVCPVAATTHSDEGLNDMAYNRCIGTRYCSNNCPVKVRRFNYFNFHKDLKSSDNDLKRMMYNPEVTVRSRGVMEKCTFCVQRVQNAKIKAKTEGRRPLRDGEIVTACQQTCPADAIRFGDLADQHSVVSKAHASERSYKLLEFLNIRPRTAHLARITNPNPALVEA
ncbi:MAG: TAT-variant-translocated molybdopterin oxidoreductase [Planctomycetota bacterium]